MALLDSPAMVLILMTSKIAIGSMTLLAFDMSYLVHYHSFPLPSRLWENRIYPRRYCNGFRPRAGSMSLIVVTNRTNSSMSLMMGLGKVIIKATSSVLHVGIFFDRFSVVNLAGARGLFYVARITITKILSVKIDYPACSLQCRCNNNYGEHSKPIIGNRRRYR